MACPATSALRGSELEPSLPIVELTAVPHLLGWSGEGSEGLIRATSVRYLTWTSKRLGSLFSSIAASDHPRAAEVREAAVGLSDAVFFRLLIAPEIFATVAGTSGRTPDELVDFLIRSVSVERGGPGWSAVGDLDRGGRGAVPKLPGGTPVDAESPLALRVVEPRCGPPLPFEGGLGSVVEGLSEAVAALRQVAPAAAALVKDFTRVVVVRREAEFPTVFRSSSTNAVIGRTLLVNPQLPTVTTVDFAEALVHEAIHHTLYMAELGTPMIRDRAACDGVRPTSPWTGNPLTVHSYLHACLVWFGLLQLWSRPGAVALGDLGPRIEQLRAGFTNPLVDPLMGVADALDPSVLQLLAEVEARARA